MDAGPAKRSSRQALFFNDWTLPNPLDDFPCSVAAFARLIGLLARLVRLLAGPLALGADILACAGRALRRVVLGGVLSEWVA